MHSYIFYARITQHSLILSDTLRPDSERRPHPQEPPPLLPQSPPRFRDGQEIAGEHLGGGGPAHRQGLRGQEGAAFSGQILLYYTITSTIWL